MSVSRIIQQAAAGNAGEAVYVDDVFSTYLYDGNATARSIVNGIDLDGEGGLVWTKERSDAANHHLYDTERGALKRIFSNTTDAEQSIANSLTSFNSDGFSLGTGGTSNANGEEYVSWTFRKQPGFFDVVTWSGDGTTNRQISHSLGSTPGMIIVKSRTGTDNWYTYHRSLGSGKFVKLNSTDVAFTDTPGDMWGNTDPTDSVFTVGNPGYLNYSGWDYVAYVFAHDAQDFGTDSDEAIIKCGSYTGNGSTNGPEINLGFEPQWLLIKNTNNSDNWLILDTMRGIATGGNDPYLYPNLSNPEVTTADRVDVTPTGFKVTSSSGQVNDNTYNYIYMAIRRPHKPASELTATDMFSPIVGTSSSDWIFDAGFPVDLHFYSLTSNNRFVFDRLRGSEYLTFNSQAAGSAYTCDFDYMNYCDVSGSNNNGWTMYNFKRTPGFFDMVTYTGNGTATSSTQTINHNLGVVPEIVICKRRTGSTFSSDWWTHHKDLVGQTAFGSARTYPETGMRLNTDGAFPGANVLNSAPTDTQFVVVNSNTTNANNEDYIAYLFATAPGISKVGVYTGNAGTKDIDCGFSNGARFVLIKSVNNTGGWYLWDSARGIVAGNDPYFLLNSTSYSNSTDFIDPLSSGFQLNANGNGYVNTNGSIYIFLAIA